MSFYYVDYSNGGSDFSEPPLLFTLLFHGFLDRYELSVIYAFAAVPIGIHHIIYISYPASVQNAEYVPSGALSRITILTLLKKGI